MTATLSSMPPPRRPARSGEPWTEGDYEALVRLCLEGADLAAMAEELQRRDTAVLNRARRMLPLDERGLPADRALVQLRTHLRDDPGYDWAARLTESPPRRPVQYPVHTHQLNGIRGLEDEQLLDVAELVVTGPSTRVATHQQVLDAVVERCLADTLVERIGERLVARAMRDAGLGAPVRSSRSVYGPWDLDPDGRPWESYGAPDPDPEEDCAQDDS